MKAKIEPISVSFAPRQLTITIESMAEGRALFAVFNHIDNLTLLIKSGANPYLLYELLKEFGTKLNEEIVEGVSYTNWYSKQEEENYV